MKYNCNYCKIFIRKTKKEVYNCSKCGLHFCGKHIRSRVDESNEAITKNAKLICEICKVKY